MHALVDNHVDQQPYPQQPQYQQQRQYQQPQYQPGYAPVQQQYGMAQGGGMLHRFPGSSFGNAMAMGAGFGLGDDLINDIFH